MTDDVSSMTLHALFFTEPRLMVKGVLHRSYGNCEIYFNIIFASTLNLHLVCSSQVLQEH
jgi:hypothetical protein